MPGFRALFLGSKIGALKPGIIYSKNSLLIIMPAFRALFLICRMGALNPGIIYREDTCIDTGDEGLGTSNAAISPSWLLSVFRCKLNNSSCL